MALPEPATRRSASGLRGLLLAAAVVIAAPRACTPPMPPTPSSCCPGAMAWLPSPTPSPG
ncbi:hypothetical protein ACFQWF_26350 [Methylorubrum suomiense]